MKEKFSVEELAYAVAELQLRVRTLEIERDVQRGIMQIGRTYHPNHTYDVQLNSGYQPVVNNSEDRGFPPKER